MARVVEIKTYNLRNGDNVMRYGLMLGGRFTSADVVRRGTGSTSKCRCRVLKKLRGGKMVRGQWVMDPAIAARQRMRAGRTEAPLTCPPMF